MSQVDAARAAGVGRSTLIHLEQGRKDIRLSNALAIARAMGATMSIAGESDGLSDRRRERAEEALKLSARREAHMRLALRLSLGEPRALRALEGAREMVRVWKESRTCSPFYISKWTGILKGSPAQVARRVSEIESEWLDAMLQNTPFSGAFPRA